MVEFSNKEVMVRVLEEFSLTLPEMSREKQKRCFLNYMLLVDKCYDQESRRVVEGVKGHWHHILPRSLYPEFAKPPKGERSNWNLVFMTPKEHFISHHLLYEIYNRSGPMYLAFKRITQNLSVKEFFTRSNLEQLNNNCYKHSEETRKNLSKARSLRVISDETRRRMSEAKLGKVLSEEVKKRISKSHLGKIHKKMTCPHCLKEGGGRFSYFHFDRCRMNPEIKEEVLTELNKKVKRSNITCPYCLKSGGSNIMKQYHFDNCKEKPGFSEYDLNKRNERNRRRSYPERTCPHCFKSGSGSGMTRYHFDNCKYKV